MHHALHVATTYNYDSTYCIRPLATFPFTLLLAFKLGTAKFFGWDPKPALVVGCDELKVYAGADLEFGNCWGQVIGHESPQMDKFTLYRVGRAA